MSNLPGIVPICLYRNVQIPDICYVGSPLVLKNKKDGFTCVNPSDRHRKNWVHSDTIYVVNPMLRPIPSHTYILRVKNTDKFPYNSVSIVHEYDPFYSDTTSTFFGAWLNPTPYTTPLHIYKKGNGILLSFDHIPTEVQTSISPIYVLTEKPRKTTVLPKSDWFQIGKDGAPKFLFQRYQGRCIPNPNGIWLDQCSLEQNILYEHSSSLLKYLDQKKSSSTYIPSTNVLGIVNFSLFFLFVSTLFFVIFRFKT